MLSMKVVVRQAQAELAIIIAAAMLIRISCRSLVIVLLVLSQDAAYITESAFASSLARYRPWRSQYIDWAKVRMPQFGAISPRLLRPTEPRAPVNPASQDSNLQQEWRQAILLARSKVRFRNRPSSR